MKNAFRRSQKGIWISMVLLIVGLTAFAQDGKSKGIVKGNYGAIQVSKFTVDSGVEFPPETLDVMMAEIVDELTRLHTFKNVAFRKESDVQVPRDAPSDQLRLVGVVTKFSAGSRTARYLIGFGAGTTKVSVRIRFEDNSSGLLLYEQAIDGKVIMGLFGGDSNGATRDLARKVAQVARKRFFK